AENSEKEEDFTTYERLVQLKEILGVEIGDTTDRAVFQSDVRASTTPTGPVMVAGKLAAGVFREVEDFDQSEPERTWEPLDPRFPNARRMAFDVEGDSMN